MAAKKKNSKKKSSKKKSSKKKTGKKKSTRKYGATAGKTVKKVMHEKKHGTLRSGRSKKKVTSRKQAIAIGLSEARAAGAKVPARKKSPRKKR